MKSRFERFLIALIFALFAAGVTLIIASADDGNGTTAPSQFTSDCSACHADYQTAWESGAHGHAMSDPVFTAAWTAQGKPGACLVCHTTGYDPATGKSASEGVACVACHNPVPANHPKDSMPVSTSPDACGECHSDPRFSTENWELSTHYQRGMECVVCHDPHTAGMKTIANPASATTTNNVDASALCENCHKDAMNNFPTSKHAEAGVTCVNCHLGFNVNDQNADFGTIHKAPDHSFLPSLDTCNKCHADQMHAPGEAIAAAAIKVEEIGGTPTPEPTPVVSAVPQVSNEPTPVSPIGFSAMAGVIGLAGGMVLAPWLERWYHHVVKHDSSNEEQSDDKENH